MANEELNLTQQIETVKEFYAALNRNDLSTCLSFFDAKIDRYELEIPRAEYYHLITKEGNIMATINPHINFNGNAEEAFEFYRSVFGGEFAKVIRFKDVSFELPAADHEKNKIMHIALPIGKNILMGNDIPEVMGKVSENENRSKISISAESREEADQLFVGLSAGGSVEMPIGDSPWGSYFAMFRDKFGIEWMIEFDPR